MRATAPDTDVLIDIGEHIVVTDEAGAADLTLVGPAAELVDALSIRAPLSQTIPAETAWMLGGLATTFDND